jgi:hydrogenase/urease accessory protein HupE
MTSGHHRWWNDSRPNGRGKIGLNYGNPAKGVARRSSDMGLMFLNRWRGATIAVLTCGLIGTPTALAHEIGTTRVTAAFTLERAFAIEIAFDAPTLLGKLEARASRPRSGTLTAGEYQRRIEDLQSEFLRHVGVSFDGIAVQPAFEYVPDPQTDSGLPPTATIRLSGTVPSGARTFAWRYDLTYAIYALTVKPSGTAVERTDWLEGGQVSAPIPLDRHLAAPSRVTVGLTYLALGFTHILPKGLDHILFVLGLFLFSRRLEPMLWQVSAFTVAHSITLGLTLYGVVSLSPSLVEPLIALSIVYVAVENIMTSELKPWRVALVFGFGLLHGMGFAGVLRDLGLPRSEFLTGLITFNVGVEAGQLTVIAAASLLVAYWSKNRAVYRRLVVVPGSALIALVGLYWTIERLV